MLLEHSQVSRPLEFSDALLEHGDTPTLLTLIEAHVSYLMLCIEETAKRWAGEPNPQDRLEIGLALRTLEYLRPIAHALRRANES